MPEPHDHQWQDTGFAAVEDCAVPGCEAVRSEPNDKPEREWSYMDRQTGLTGDDVDEQGRLTYTTESASDARSVRDRLLDDLRFGPMAHYMMGWSEEQRTMLVTDLADDLLRSGYTLAEPCNGAHNMSTEVENGEI